MLTVVFVGTFLATGLFLVVLIQLFFGRRRAREILLARDATEQRATVVRSANLLEQGEAAFLQAGLTWSFRTYLTVAVAAVMGAVLLIMAGGLVPALGLISIVVGGPWALVRYRQAIRAKKFAEQLPAALTLAANTIRAGGTMLQAVGAVARDMPDPIGSEFARIKQALQLQVPLAAALEQARQRIGVPQFNSVVVACKVAGQAGADLDVLLESIARETVEDGQFQEAMRAASSEGRTSAKVVTAVPFLGAAFFFFQDHTYFRPMLEHPTGRVLLFGSIGAIICGWVAIKRITDVRDW